MENARPRPLFSTNLKVKLHPKKHRAEAQRWSAGAQDLPLSLPHGSAAASSSTATASSPVAFHKYSVGSCQNPTPVQRSPSLNTGYSLALHHFPVSSLWFSLNHPSSHPDSSLLPSCQTSPPHTHTLYGGICTCSQPRAHPPEFFWSLLKSHLLREARPDHPI